MRGVFWLSTAVLCYTYAGYPLLVMALARLRRRPVRTAPYEPAVSIIIAARNEAKSIRATLENKLQLHYPAGRSEEHTSELQSRVDLVCRLLLEKKKKAENQQNSR